MTHSNQSGLNMNITPSPEQITSVQTGVERDIAEPAVLGVLNMTEAATLGAPETPENFKDKQAVIKEVGGLALQLASVEKAFGIVYTTDEEGHKTPSHYMTLAGSNIGDRVRRPEDHNLPPVEKAWESHLANQAAKQTAIEQSKKMAEATRPTRDFMQEAEGLVSSNELPHASHRLMKVAEAAIQDAKRLAKDPVMQQAFITKALMVAGAIRDMQGSDNAMKLAIATELFTKEEVRDMAQFNGNLGSAKMQSVPGFEQQIVGLTNEVVGRLVHSKARPLVVAAMMGLGIGASITSNQSRSALYSHYEDILRQQITSV